MLSVDLSSVEGFLLYFSQHRNLAYPILFFGAFFETLLPFSLIVHGELFFLSGSLLAGAGTLDIWLVALLLYAGGILGDNVSYWLGRTFGPEFLEKCGRRPVVSRLIPAGTWEKGSAFFHKWGGAAVFWARLSGPFSWFIPALAGSFQQPYCRFALFNALGVIIGIGEFLVLGYLLGDNLERISAWLTRFGYIPLALIVALLPALFWLRWHRLRQAALHIAR